MKKITQLLLTFILLTPTVFLGDEKAASVHDFTVNDIAGKEVDLADYKGKILLIVNVASECGVTAQYETLQALYDVLKERDFVVMGFPSNEFGGQEPGSDQEIATFCKTEYAVTFPMFSKIETNGEKQAPLFNYLTTAKNPDKEGAVGWNFEKFLVGKDGKLIRRFASSDEPDGPEIIAAIKSALADK
ncbi:UNVERIFIED_CONTAM: hypothetical protein GTU68_019719 [Idotea baltica]|nr:hypothetical protein [Idotea baltica]